MINNPKAVRFLKLKKSISIPLFVILCVIIFAVLAKPAIETRTWVLFTAQQKNASYAVVAHKPDYYVSNDNLFAFSKEIELTCVAKDGKLTITDKTNGKTYEGTYEPTSWGKFQSYDVVIDGIEGTANISSGFNRTLLVSVGDYILNFEAE